ncbi:MAG: type II toxin-antitoxin system RelE/ParE family toxin [Phocaeicola sp.]
MNERKVKIAFMNTAREFVSSLPEKVQKKITYNLLKVEGGEMDKELFKKLENSEIWEFRTLFNGICYRLFAFWDTEIEALIVATHGMVKKTQKTPKSEIEKAEKLRKSTSTIKNK